MLINNLEFDLKNKTYIMGILNVTPDSFSDGGKFNSYDSAKRQVQDMLEAGADLIDVGGESTRPGYIPVSDQEEIERVTCIVEMIRKEFGAPVSVDTYKSKVAEASIQAGAGLINDIWGFKYDRKMASVIAKNDAACCLMHNRENKEYGDFVEDVIMDLRDSLKIAVDAGVRKDQIMIDPGIGFAKSFEQNLLMLKEINTLNQLGYPILLGTSRKSCIGLALDVDVNNRVEGTLATTAYAMIKANVSFFRVHDVKENARLIKMIQAIQKVEA